MMKTKSAKVFAGFLGLTMALSTFAIPAGAQTTAELTAQINSLLAMIAQLQAQIAGQGGSTTGASMMFTSDLTIGSTGSEVTALQQWLVQKGYLTMPAGVAYGYFGTLTQSALAKYQAEAGISPAAGYFGPITRAKVNAAAGTTTGGTTTGGTTTGGSTGITTPGVEGTLAVTQNNSGVASTVYVGDSMVAVLGFNAEAKNSDIAIQRVKIDLGTDTSVYNDIYRKIYVTDGSNVLASSDLNSSTVVKDGGRYYITIAGFNMVVPKGSKKQMVIKADLYGSIDSTEYDTETYTIRLASQGVRGVDGAGIDQYAGDTSITRTPTISAELADTATLKISLNNSSPKAMDVIAADGSNDDEMDKVSMLMFDLKAEKDDVTVTDLVIDLTYSGSGAATATTVYLFDGSTELDSASVVNAGAGAITATFSDLDYVVPKDTTKTLTAKVDIRDANGTVRTITLDIDTADVTAENSKGDSITESGSAAGYAMSVRNAGVEITLVSKSITTSGVAQTGSNPLSTSTLTATFNVKVKALGNDIVLGSVASTSGKRLFDNTGATNSFQLFLNGAPSTYSLSTSTSYTIPSTCTSISGMNSCTLAEGNEVTVPVTFQIPGRYGSQVGVDSGLYSVELQSVNWSSDNGATITSSTFMNGEADWKTADVSFP